MRIEDCKLFVMVDDSDDELYLTKALFHHTHPRIAFLCEKEPSGVVAAIGRHITTGTRAAEICVLIDIRMPKMNGFELIYELRNDIGSYDCCILMLSASRASDDHDNSVAIGADGFVLKPFTVAKLQAALASRETPGSPTQGP